MKVLMINTVNNRGGAARMAVTLAEVFNQESIDIEAQLIHFGDNVTDKTFIGIRRSWIHYLTALQTRIVGSYRIHDFGVSKEILRHAKNADVIHLHNLHGYYVDYVHLLKNISNKPIVWTWHDMWGATGRCGASGGCLRWENGCAPCPYKNIYPAAWLDNSRLEFEVKFSLFSSLKRLQIVCPSEWLANIAIKRGFKAKQVTVIPNPVDTEVFQQTDKKKSRLELDLDASRPIALFVADNCNDQRKGYRDFCEATQDSGYHAIAIGLSPRNPSEHVTHIGRIDSRSKLAQYYAAADVMVIPSYADNYPNTVIESLVSGTPVIGYDEGGIPSQLTDQFSIVTPKGQIDALRQALESFLSTIDDARRFSRELATESMRRWSKHTVANCYFNAYKGLVGNST